MIFPSTEIRNQYSKSCNAQLYQIKMTKTGKKNRRKRINRGLLYIKKEEIIDRKRENNDESEDKIDKTLAKKPEPNENKKNSRGNKNKSELDKRKEIKYTKQLTDKN